MPGGVIRRLAKAAAGYVPGLTALVYGVGTQLLATGDGVLQLLNAAGAAGKLLLGVADGTGVLLLRSANGQLSVRLGNDTGSGSVLAGGYNFANGSLIMASGTGAPEGVITANVGSIWLRTNGGASTTLYVKESGTGNTGWIAK